MLVILGHLSFVKVFLDDVLIHSEDFEAHYSHLKIVLGILRQNGLTLNIEKSTICAERVNFLGHIISAKGISPDTDTIKKIAENKPRSIRDIQKILGIINWYRPFIENIAAKTLFLTHKLKQDKKFVWEKKDDEAMHLIIKDVEKGLTLKFPIFEKPFELYTDASNSSISGVLKQGENLIGLYGKKLNKSERNYSIMEKELYAILKSLEHFKPSIFSSPITLYTDNQDIIKDSNSTQRVQRRKFLLSEYNHEIRHIKGKSNYQADLISRVLSIREILNGKIGAEHEGSYLAENKKIVYKNTVSEIATNMNIATPRKHQIYETLIKLHDLLGHPGRKAFYVFTKAHYSKTKGLKHMIDDIITRCLKCQLNKHNCQKYGKQKGCLDAEKFNDKVSSEILGPLKTKHYNFENKHEYFYIITFTDIFTKLTEIEIIFAIKSQEILKSFENKWIKRYSIPKMLATDQGRQYISALFEDKLKLYRVKHIQTSAYNPTGNSVSERKNSVILQVCRIF
ncbi:Transposon Tf2-9 polyprotein [Dictyocoela muelleri]|nr:Transposon Tf2-9 polyprotein [Dictyocoela muelleri]